MRRLAIQLRAARRRRKDTQEAAAWVIGVTQNTFARWERDEMQPSKFYIREVRRYIKRAPKRC